MFFHPENPRWRRGVSVVSLVACSFVVVQMIVFQDFRTNPDGTNVYSSLRKYTTPAIDRYYGIRPEELRVLPKEITDAKKDI